MRGAVMLGAALVALAPAPAVAEERAWSARVGWETTTLGDARPAGFGMSGGHTIRGGAERVLFRPGAWIWSVVGEGRLYGFERTGDRTIGLEVDVGARIERSFYPALLEMPIRVGALVSAGAFRAPLATEIGPMRFIGMRPAFEVGAAYAWRPGAEVRGYGGCRLYSTLVWTGCSWSAGVSGGWTW